MREEIERKRLVGECAERRAFVAVSRDDETKPGREREKQRSQEDEAERLQKGIRTWRSETGLLV